MDRGRYILFPNLYVVLVSDSAFLRRSVAQKIGVNTFFRKLPACRVFADRITAEGIIDNIGRISRRPDGTNFEESTALIWAPEMPMMFGGDDTTTRRAAIFLTDVYEGKKEHQHTTRSRGPTGKSPQKIFNVVISFLGSTAPDWLEKLPPEMVGGGFTGRILFITADRRKKAIAWPMLTPEEILLEADLLNDLQHIGNLHGEMKPSKATYDLFQNWYEVEIPKMKIPFGDQRAKPYFERMHDHAMKVAMINSLAESDNLIVEEHHMRNAIDRCVAILKGIPNAIASLGASELAKHKEHVFRLIEKNPQGVKHSDLLRSVSWKLTSQDLKIVIQTLIDEDRVEIAKGFRPVVYVAKKQPNP